MASVFLLKRRAAEALEAFLAFPMIDSSHRLCFILRSVRFAGRFARGDDAGNAELGGYKYDAEEAAGFQRVEAGGKIGAYTRWRCLAMLNLFDQAFLIASATLPACGLIQWAQFWLFRLSAHRCPLAFTLFSFASAVPSETATRGYGSSRGGGAGGRGGARGGAGAGSAGGAGSKGYDDRAVRAAGRKATSGRDRDGGRGARGGRGGYRGGGMRRGPGGALTREPSVHIGGDWDLLETADFAALQKLTSPAPLAGEKVTDVAWAGSLQAYDEDFDRTAAKGALWVRQTLGQAEPDTAS